MRLSIIIVNWNTKELLDACLASINRHKGEIECQIIVLDNNSSDQSAAMVRSKYPNVELIALDKNLGFGKGNNLALKQVTVSATDFVLLLNPDTEIRPYTLQTVLDLMEREQEIGICGVRQDEPSGQIQSSCGNFPSLKVMLAQQLMCFAARMHRLDMAKRLSQWLSVPLMPVKDLLPYFDFAAVADVQWVMGAFMMIRKEALPKDHLFDEDFVMYGEDLDLCERVRRSGFRITYCGLTSILHHGGASTKSVSIRADAMHSVAMVHLYRKHHPLSSWIYRVLLATGSSVAVAKGILKRQQDTKLRGLARLKVALNPSWTGFLQ